ncbi:MAG: ATP-binding protein [Candidatus Anstonellales archaeon]
MVNVEDIKTAIVDREADLETRFREEKIVDREARAYAERLISKDAALVITGPRRCGKSILAFMLGSGKNFAYVNFEDERIAIRASELNKVLEAIYSLKGEVDLLIFDEIQNVPGWERFVSRLMGTKKIILTGSNATLLSKELATYLTGRHIDIMLFPFSFREFLDLKGFAYNVYKTFDRARIRNYFEEYIEIGGFPLAQKLGRIFLAENYKDIIERDVTQRYKVKHPAALKELAKYLISNVSNEISFNKIKNILGVKSSHTIKQYYSYLSNAYLIFMVERFSFKLKERILAPKKIYCIDNGIVSTVGFKISDNRGRAMENLVAVELLRKASKNKKFEVYYWKDYQQREVDFVIKNGKSVIGLVQTTAISSREEMDGRELGALVKASKELRCNNLLVITRDYEGEEKVGQKSIRFIPLWKWLILEPE